MDKIITEGKELGVYLYMLTGGEPLVRKADICLLYTSYKPEVLALDEKALELCQPYFKQMEDIRCLLYTSRCV